MTRPLPRILQDGPRDGRLNPSEAHSSGGDAHIEPFDDAVDTHERDLHSAGVQPLRRPLASRQGTTQNRDMSEPAVSPSVERANGAERAADDARGAQSPPHAAGSGDGAGQPQSQPHNRRVNGKASEEHGEPLSPDDPLAPLPFNPYKGNRGVTRAWHAMKNSFAGFRVAIREESAFRQELTLAAILVPCGVLVPVDAVARVLLLGSVLLVLIVELLNSSVEAAIDRISLERHELSRRAKDLGSAAVMVALGMCVMTWVLIVGPLVVHWVRGWF